MKASLNTFWLITLGFFFIVPFTGKCQSRFSGQGLSISVTGTSTLHDWEMKSDKGVCEAVITVTNSIVTFSALSFNIPAESLKSGHNAMDKNYFKALDTKKNPNITFTLSSVTSITTSGLNTYVFKGIGKLAVAGTTKATEILATLTYNPGNKSFTCTGITQFRMSDYGVKPPTVMLGTIKTGDLISIHYNIIIKR